MTVPSTGTGDNGERPELGGFLHTEFNVSEIDKRSCQVSTLDYGSETQ